jgi:hypothetical protein
MFSAVRKYTRKGLGNFIAYNFCVHRVNIVQNGACLGYNKG